MPGQSPPRTELDEARSVNAPPSAPRHAGPKNRRKIVFACLAAVMGALVSLVVLEIGLRLINPDWLSLRMRELNAGEPFSYGTDQNWPSIKENGVFSQFAPNSTFTVRHDEYEHAATIDDLGGRATPYSPDHNTLVPVMGDSFTFGLGVEDSETFLALIAPELPARLLNLGVPGSGLHDQLNIIELRHKSLGAPPIYVFMLFMGNDLTNIRDRHERAAAVRSGIEVDGDRDWLWRANNSIVNHRVLKRAHFIQFLRRPVQRLFFPNRTDFMQPVFLVMRTDSTYLEESLVYFRLELDRLTAMSREFEFRTAFVLLPDVHQIDEDRRTGKAKSIGLTDDQLDPDHLTRAIRNSLDEFGIGYADLTPCLERSFTDDLYYIRDDHFTATGHATAANCLRQNDLLTSFLAE